MILLLHLSSGAACLCVGGALGGGGGRLTRGVFVCTSGGCGAEVAWTG